MKHEWHSSQYEYLSGCIARYDYERDTKPTPEELLQARKKLQELLRRCRALYPHSRDQGAQKVHPQRYLFRLYRAHKNMCRGRYDHACSYLEEMLLFEKTECKEMIPRNIIANMIAVLEEDLDENQHAKIDPGTKGLE